MRIEFIVSRDKAVKCGEYLKNHLENYIEICQSPDDDIYFGLEQILKALDKSVKDYDKGL